MKKKFYLPTREPERVVWLKNFNEKIGVHGASLGITAGEIAAVDVMFKFYDYIIGIILLSRTYTQDLTKFKDRLSIAPLGTLLGTLPSLTLPAAPPASDAGIFTIISGFVQRMKASSNYTTAIGEDLGIIGAETTFDQDAFVPQAKGKAMPGSVEISFVKDVTDGMNIYSHPAGNPDPNVWEKLAYDTESPYNDTRPLRTPGTPEIREYRMRGVIHDAEIGQWSDIIRVTFSG